MDASGSAGFASAAPRTPPRCGPMPAEVRRADCGRQPQAAGPGAEAKEGVALGGAHLRCVTTTGGAPCRPHRRPEPQYAVEFLEQDTSSDRSAVSQTVSAPEAFARLSPRSA